MRYFKQTLNYFARIVILPISLCWMMNTAHANDCDQPITLGWDIWEPYQFLDANQQVTGLDIELVQEIVAGIGCELKIVQLSWRQNIKAIENGSIVMAAGASKTPERESYAYFSEAYRKEDVGLFVRQADLGGLKELNLAQILATQSFKLGISRGVYYGDYFADLAEQPNNQPFIQEVNYTPLNHNKLLRYRIDGFLGDAFSVQHSLNRAKLDSKIIMHPKKIHEDEVYLMVSKKAASPELVKSINASLKQIIKNGIYSQITNKYLKPETSKP